MIAVSAVFICTVLVISHNVLPVCCQDYRRPPPFHSASDSDVETLENSVETLQRNYNYSVPSTPRPEDVQCFVEIPTTTRIGGTCVRIRPDSNIWLCQAGADAQVNFDCEARFGRHQLFHPSRPAFPGRRRGSRRRRN